MTSIPFDVIERIVDAIPDEATLRSISLVSSELVKPAQKRLYETLFLPRYDEYGKPRSVHDLFDRWPHLATYVLSLIFDGSDLVNSPQLPGLLDRLPKLRRLCIDGRFIWSLESTSLSAFVAIAQTKPFTTFEILNTHDVPVALLNNNPALRRLVFRFSLLAFPPHDNKSSKEKAVLQHLNLAPPHHFPPGRDIATWARSPSCNIELGQLQSLVITACPTNFLLLHLTPLLRTLTIEITDDYADRFSPADFDLSRLQCLELITIKTSAYQSSDIKKLYESFLLLPPTSKIKKLELVVYVQKLVIDPMWKKLDTLFASPPWAGVIGKVTLNFSEGEYALDNMLRSYFLPRLAARGLFVLAEADFPEDLLRY